MNYALTTRKAALTAAQAAMKGITRRSSRCSIYSSPEAKRRTGVMVSFSSTGLSIAGQMVPAEVADGLHGYQVTLDGHLLCDLLKRMAGVLVSLTQVDGVLVLESASFKVELVGWDVRMPDPAPVTEPEIVAVAEAQLPDIKPKQPRPVPAAGAQKAKRPTKRHPNTSKTFYAQEWSL